jgi:hypothetical protein
MPDATMQIVAQLGLMFRATVLNQLAAKVQLARSHYSPARFTAALTGINNREDQLAARFGQGRLSVGKLQQQARELARQDVLLYEVDTQAESRPMELASAFHRVLVRTHLHADRLLDPTVKHQLQELLDPDHVRNQARHMLAQAFWAGYLSDPLELSRQVMKQAHYEAIAAEGSQADRDRVEARAAQEILSFVTEQQPDGIDPIWQPLQLTLQSVELPSKIPDHPRG